MTDAVRFRTQAAKCATLANRLTMKRAANGICGWNKRIFILPNRRTSLVRWVRSFERANRRPQLKIIAYFEFVIRRNTHSRRAEPASGDRTSHGLVATSAFDLKRTSPFEMLEITAPALR